MFCFDTTLPGKVHPQPKKTILLVNRPGHLRDALMGLLLTLPEVVNVQTAESALLALGMMSQCSPDLLLIGGGLPETEPCELVRQFHRHWPNTPCLVLAEDAEQVESAYRAGANSILHPRSTSRQLLSKIHGLINK